MFLSFKLALLIAEWVLLLPLIAWLIWRRRRHPAEANSTRSPGMPSRALLNAAYLVTTIPAAWALDLGIYQADESAYLFQAHCLQAGNLSMTFAWPVLPSDVAFTQHVFYRGNLFGKYPFGWPAVLAIGSAVNCEWLVNPLLGVLLLYLMTKIAAEALPAGQSRYAALIYVVSPFFVLNTIGFMSHVLSGVLASAATWSYLRHRATGSLAWLVAMVACLGACATARPFTAACLAAVLVPAAVWSVRREWRTLGAFLICGLAVGAVSSWTLLETNHQLTGQYLGTPYFLFASAFTPQGGLVQGPGDLMRSLFIETPKRLADTAITSFPFLFLFAAYGVWRRPRQSALFAALFLGFVLAYVIQLDNSDSPIGERYYFEAFFAVAILAGMGWAQMAADLRWSRKFQGALMIALCAIALAGTAAFTFWEVELRWPARQVERIASRPPFKEGAVFLATGPGFAEHRYNFNRPSTQGVLYLRDPGPTERFQAASRLGFRNWAALLYDRSKRVAYWELPRAQ